MKCPNCNETLVMTERQGVEIDYCPKCRGVWLDKGELDKIIERSTSFDNTTGDDYYRNDQEEYPKHKDRQDQRQPQRKKRGFLGDLFDFD
jgi:Zn-finger nucleic acid-binding protein